MLRRLSYRLPLLLSILRSLGARGAPILSSPRPVPLMRLHRCLLALALLLLSNAGAGAQSVSSLQAQLNKLAAAQKKMDSTLARLESRLVKLEDAGEEADKQDAAEEAEKEEAAKTLASLERRVAALERATSAKGSGGNAGAGSSRTVRAPFVVEDADGSVILQVTGGKTPRLVIGEEKGGQVELGTGSAGGGVVRVRDASNTDRVLLIGSEGHGQIRAVSSAHSAVLTSDDGEGGATLSLFSGNTPSARIRSGVQGFGAFILTDAGGEPLVFAGSMSSGGSYVGTVRAGPRARAGSLGPPSILQGAR